MFSRVNFDDRKPISKNTVNDSDVVVDFKAGDAPCVYDALFVPRISLDNISTALGNAFGFDKFIFHGSLSAQNKTEQLGKGGVADPNERTHDDNRQSDDARVRDELFIGWPRNFIEFGAHFADKLEDAFFLVFLLRQCYHAPAAKLFGFLVQGVFLAEFAILFQLDASGRIFFVFVRPVVAVFALGAGQGDIRPHGVTSCRLIKQAPLQGHLISSGGGTRI